MALRTFPPRVLLLSVVLLAAPAAGAGTGSEFDDGTSPKFPGCDNTLQKVKVTYWVDGDERSSLTGISARFGAVLPDAAPDDEKQRAAVPSRERLRQVVDAARGLRRRGCARGVHVHREGQGGRGRRRRGVAPRQRRGRPAEDGLLRQGLAAQHRHPRRHGVQVRRRQGAVGHRGRVQGRHSHVRAAEAVLRWRHTFPLDDGRRHGGLRFRVDCRRRRRRAYQAGRRLPGWGGEPRRRGRGAASQYGARVHRHVLARPSLPLLLQLQLVRLAPGLPLLPRESPGYGIRGIFSRCQTMPAVSRGQSEASCSRKREGGHASGPAAGLHLRRHLGCTPGLAGCLGWSEPHGHLHDDSSTASGAHAKYKSCVGAPCLGLFLRHFLGLHITPHIQEKRHDHSCSWQR
uniref:Uncharacterized protein n=1 Tax=Zea mays TaxID=4577 RepID=C0PKY6_MAIZE|nr:unknown [Zea mays]|eukprot:NP_001170109.1 uncharacterized LOC100384029 precursor [Zea mays]